LSNISRTAIAKSKVQHIRKEKKRKKKILKKGQQMKIEINY